MKKPELLAPAGDLEKLKAAVIFGADAVYMGGQNFGLRANAKNFGLEEMAEGIKFAHEHGVKVFITVNIFAHNEDLLGLREYFLELSDIKADGLIISDPGIFQIARKTVPHIDIHISTQANNTNYQSAMFWYELGAKRVVAARELSIGELREIKDKMPDDFELEAFVHGAMCISYSGRCLLSNYMNARDSNRGNCSQPCRWDYNLTYQLTEKNRPLETFPVYEDERGTYIFNSRDLCMVMHIDELVNAGIDSFKIEGRMKTPYYVGTVVKAYREAIDDYFTDRAKYESRKNRYLELLEKSSHRHFTTGFYFGKADSEAQYYKTSAYVRDYEFIGLVKGYNEQESLALIEQRNKFDKGDQVEFLVWGQKGLPQPEDFSQVVEFMYDYEMTPVSSARHPKQLLWIKVDKPVKEMCMLRKKS